MSRSARPPRQRLDVTVGPATTTSHVHQATAGPATTRSEAPVRWFSELVGPGEMGNEERLITMMAALMADD